MKLYTIVLLIISTVSVLTAAEQATAAPVRQERVALRSKYANDIAQLLQQARDLKARASFISPADYKAQRKDLLARMSWLKGHAGLYGFELQQDGENIIIHDGTTSILIT